MPVEKAWNLGSRTEKMMSQPPNTQGPSRLPTAVGSGKLQVTGQGRRSDCVSTK